MAETLRPDIFPGALVPELARTIEPSDLVRYAGAADDYAPQHWDHLYMVERGFPGVIVHGWFTFAVMCQAVERWITPDAAHISKYAVRYHAVTRPGAIACGGEVASVDAGARSAELKLWAKDSSGAVTTTATVTVRLA